MPLMPGTSNQVRSSNIKKLRDEGYPEKQAIAISYSEAGEKKSKPKKSKQQTSK